MFNFDDDIDAVVPYEISFSGTDNIWKVGEELAIFAQADLFYDVYGYLRLKKIDLNNLWLSPPTWIYKYGDKTDRFYAGNVRRFDDNILANHIRVLGGSSQTAEVLFDLKVEKAKYLKALDIEENWEQGRLHHVASVNNSLELDKYEIIETEIVTTFNYEESGEDFEEGELDGVVVGEDGLTLKIYSTYTNFSEYQTDTSPSGWESDDEDVGWKIIADAGAEGGKYLRGISSSSTPNPNASLYWEEIGQFQDVEILAKIRTSGNTGTKRADVGVQFRGDKDNPGRKYSFHLMRYEGSNNRVALSKSDSTGEIYATFNWSADTWYMMRVLAIGNKIKCKVWQHGTVEPENWIIDVTDDTYTEGYVGVGSRQMSNGTEMRWDEFQVSTINLQGSRISPPLDLSSVGTVKTR